MEHQDRLDLPKGHVDPGENFLQCARREFEEETGLDADDLHVVPEFEFITHYTVRSRRTANKPVLKELRIYLAWLADPEAEIRPTEHLGYRWITWEPGQSIQPQTLDPLMRCLDDFWTEHPPA